MGIRQHSNVAVITSLNGDITDTVKSLVANSDIGYPEAPFVIRNENELILVGSRAGTTFNDLTRGFDGTTQVAHLDDSVIEHVVVADDFAKNRVPAWVNHLAVRDDDPHVDDDEFDDDHFTGWTMVEPTGALDLREQRGLLSTVLYGQAGSDVSGLMKSKPAGDVTIEICYRTFGRAVNYLMIGPIMSTGTSISSPCFWVMSYWNTGLPVWDTRSGTFTNINVIHNSPGGSGPGYMISPHVYMRLEYEQSGDRFRQVWSGDGMGWSYGAWVANPMGSGPTYMGIGLSSWGGNEWVNAALEYFRVDTQNFARTRDSITSVSVGLAGEDETADIITPVQP